MFPVPKCRKFHKDFKGFLRLELAALVLELCLLNQYLYLCTMFKGLSSDTTKHQYIDIAPIWDHRVLNSSSGHTEFDFGTSRSVYIQDSR